MIDENFNYVLKIFKEAEDIEKEKSKTIKCPKCNGNLHISKSGYNGHIWAVCEKADCMKIMQ